MIENAAVNTLSFATASATSRGAISVIDRFQFGIRRKTILFTNVHNNVLAAALSLLVAAAMNRMNGVGDQIINAKVIAFALLLQLTANAFSYAFKHMKVSSIIVVSKISDIFVAPLIYLLFSRWVTGDFLFAAFTSLACLFLMVSSRRSGHLHVKSALLACGMLVLQGSLSPWYMSDVTSQHTNWLPFTVALVLWRLVFSILFSAGSLRGLLRSFQFGNHEDPWEYGGLLFTRAGLTLFAQGFQVLALTFDRPVIAWPILNSTGLIAVLLSAILLKERGSLRESVAILLITALGAAKVLM